MNTATPETHPNVKVGVQLFEERILPAKLTQQNGPYFSAWFVSKRMDVRNLTAGQIADEMHAATIADCAKPPKDRQLKWKVLPATLAKENQGRPVQHADTREASNLETRARAGEKAAVEAKAQADAKKRIAQLIEMFAPTRGGRLMFDLRDKKQAEWREKLAACKDAVSLEKQIANEQKKLYEAVEKASLGMPVRYE